MAYSYKLYNETDGSLLFEAEEKAPDVMVYGVSQEIVPDLPQPSRDLQKATSSLLPYLLKRRSGTAARNMKYLSTRKSSCATVKWQRK